jgi:hypothetical protein
MRRILGILLLAGAAAVSGGCYVTQDGNGQWWACEEYATPNGPATACTPVQAPF